MHHASLAGMSMAVSPSSETKRPGRAPHRDAAEAIGDRIRELMPGARVEEIVPFGVDTDEADATTKGIGYGEPLRVGVRDADGRPFQLVFHTATPNEYGHDRRADRAAEMILAYDTFDAIPRHSRAIDVGAIGDDGDLVSLAGTGEAYLLTSYEPGRPYAEDLRALMERGRATAEDERRAEHLASYLARLHTPVEAPRAYVRSVRDLVGDGEGIMGIIDGYPVEPEDALDRRLKRIEAAAVSWRWHLKGRPERATRTHGDFHPFNILFDDAGELALLDASRGCIGDPADDVVALSINYLFFGLQAGPEKWGDGFGRLWHRFYDTYFETRRDPELLAVAAPYFAWRALVLASPRWYPSIDERVRETLLRCTEELLGQHRFDPDAVGELMR